MSERLNEATRKMLPADINEQNCCGGPAPENVDACCVKDAQAKAAGEGGCGCNAASENAKATQQNNCCAS